MRRRACERDGKEGEKKSGPERVRESSAYFVHTYVQAHYIIIDHCSSPLL